MICPSTCLALYYFFFPSSILYFSYLAFFISSEMSHSSLPFGLWIDFPFTWYYCFPPIHPEKLLFSQQIKSKCNFIMEVFLKLLTSPHSLFCALFSLQSVFTAYIGSLVYISVYLLYMHVYMCVCTWFFCCLISVHTYWNENIIQNHECFAMCSVSIILGTQEIFLEWMKEHSS